MRVELYAEKAGSQTGWRLTGVYIRVLLWYLLGVCLLWLAGIEAIFGHPTPFYALYYPAFDTLLVPAAATSVFLWVYWLTLRFFAKEPPRFPALPVLGTAITIVAVYPTAVWRQEPVRAMMGQFLEQGAWHLPAFGVFMLGLWGLLVFDRRMNGFETPMPPKARRRLLLALFTFAVLFPCALAMLRDGAHGISQAYERATYEYIGDIGKTSSIRALFERYVELRPYLSMHAKVHPPGPIALLWLASYLVGQGALALSIATVVIGAVAVIPLFFWARFLLGERTAVAACALYVVVPSIVLFSATSADILFTPFTLGTLYFFDRAVRGGAPWMAVVAGIGYGLMSVLSFSLIGIGAYFALVGLWLLGKAESRRHVMVTAVLMGGAFLGFHFALYVWSGMDMVAVFHAAKAQFDLDQHQLDQFTPRLPAWTYRMINPVCWFYFAGIPVSILFLWGLAKPAPETKARFVVFTLTLLALNFLYLARGEGERSALYLFPFLVLPAAHALERMRGKIGPPSALAATLGFMAIQCWLTEAYLYTYW